MEGLIRKFSGRAFSPEDIAQIQWLRKAFPKLSERELASTVCETLGWVTISGSPKRGICTGFLRQLALEGVIDLPPAKTKPTNINENRKRSITELANTLPDNMQEITEADGIELEMVHAGSRMKLLRAYLKKYHMIGDNLQIGEKIYYFIRDNDGNELGCMIFGPAAWALEERDNWIGWTAGQRKERLFLIVNQNRYLIFPWVHVRNLSSRALSIAAKRLPKDWLARYCYEPVLLETFVECA